MDHWTTQHPREEEGKEEGVWNNSNKNSVQNRFTVLSHQKDTFLRETREASQTVVRIREAHQTSKAEHDCLVESSRQEKELLGQRMETLAMMKEEEARLFKLQENEFLAIRDCTNHSKMLDQEKEEASRNHTAEMEVLNEELAILLEGRFFQTAENRLSIRSVQALIENKIENENDWSERDDLLESAAILEEATNDQERTIARIRELYTMMHGPCSTSDSHSNESEGIFEHMDLFYGQSQQAESN